VLEAVRDVAHGHGAGAREGLERGRGRGRVPRRTSRPATPRPELAHPGAEAPLTGTAPCEVGTARRWQWALTRPGSSTPAPRSTTSPQASRRGARPTQVMRPSATATGPVTQGATARARPTRLRRASVQHPAVLTPAPLPEREGSPHSASEVAAACWGRAAPGPGATSSRDRPRSRSASCAAWARSPRPGWRARISASVSRKCAPAAETTFSSIIRLPKSLAPKRSET